MKNLKFKILEGKEHLYNDFYQNYKDIAFDYYFNIRYE